MSCLTLEKTARVVRSSLAWQAKERLKRTTHTRRTKSGVHSLCQQSKRLRAMSQQRKGLRAISKRRAKGYAPAKERAKDYVPARERAKGYVPAKERVMSQQKKGLRATPQQRKGLRAMSQQRKGLRAMPQRRKGLRAISQQRKGVKRTINSHVVEDDVRGPQLVPGQTDLLQSTVVRGVPPQPGVLPRLDGNKSSTQSVRCWWFGVWFCLFGF